MAGGENRQGIGCTGTADGSNSSGVTHLFSQFFIGNGFPIGDVLEEVLNLALEPWSLIRGPGEWDSEICALSSEVFLKFLFRPAQNGILSGGGIPGVEGVILIGEGQIGQALVIGNEE